MGQLTQTTTELQAIVDNSDAANVGKTSLTDGSDTTAVAFKKSGFYSLQGSSANAPSTDRAVLISAVRNTAATGEIRYGQIAITESNGLWWNRDDGGSLGTWYAAVSTTGTQTLTNKTLTSPVLTTPQINDSASDHQYIFAGSNLVADRTVTLPLLTGDDTFVFEAHTQTLTNKTLTSPVFNTGVSGTAVLDADDFTGASATTLASSESIKAYVDTKFASGNELSEVLAAGNTTGANDIEVTAAQKVQFRDSAIYLNSSVDGQLDIVADTEIQIAATTIDINGAIVASGEISAASLDISGDIDVDGTTNLDVVDIDGAVDMASTLAVAGAVTVTGNLINFNTGSGNAPYIQHAANQLDIRGGTGSTRFLNNAGSQSTVTIRDTGNVIGSGLDVIGSVTADGLTVDGNPVVNGTSPQLFLQTGASNTNWQIAAQENVVNAFEISSGAADASAPDDTYTKRLVVQNNGDISFYEDTGTTPKFFWDASAESLGIGTSSPSDLMTIQSPASGGGNGITLKRNDNGTGQRVGAISFGNTVDSDLAQITAQTSTGNNGDGNLLFHTQPNGGVSTERLRIDASGNLLVGITGVVAAGSDGVQIHAAVGYISSGRNTTAGASHHIFYNPNGIVGNIETSGSATAYNTSSDQRLKENIADAPSASEDIDAIQVRSFDWKADGEHQKYGMVAQELLKVAPSAVSAPEDPEEMMGVDYSKLVPMMLKEIQSLRARIAALES